MNRFPFAVRTVLEKAISAALLATHDDGTPLDREKARQHIEKYVIRRIRAVLAYSDGHINSNELQKFVRLP